MYPSITRHNWSTGTNYCGRIWMWKPAIDNQTTRSKSREKSHEIVVQRWSYVHGQRELSPFSYTFFFTCRLSVYKLHHIYNSLFFSFPLKSWYNYQNTFVPKPGPWLTQIQLTGTQDISPTKLSEDWKWIPIHHPSISNPSRKVKISSKSLFRSALVVVL